MRLFAPLALSLLPCFLWAQPSPPPPLPIDDPLLASLLEEALARNPGLARSEAALQAEALRVSQASALPDPSLSIGLQNDGFKKLQIGEMEGSYYQVMLTQPLPWPGKRALRGALASGGVELARTEQKRARTTLMADLKRAYFGLLLTRSQAELLSQQETLWQKASEATKARYEVGQGTQADLLRAHLERNRIQQTRLALQGEERTFLATLNRLRGLEADAPLATSRRLEDTAPSILPLSEWLQRAEMECCEIQDARLLLQQSERALALARRDRFPDLAVSAGVMPRGSLEPMWQVGISISLPIWSGRKQQRAVQEQEWRRRGGESELANVRSLLRQRIHERNAQLEAALESLKIYREGLLVQSEASFQASLAQYEAGRGSFLAVMESLNGWTADRSGYLQTLAQAHALAIAQEEFNLSGTPPISASGLGATPMGMGGSNSGSPASAASPSKPASGGSESGPAMRGM